MPKYRIIMIGTVEAENEEEAYEIFLSDIVPKGRWDTLEAELIE